MLGNPRRKRMSGKRDGVMQSMPEEEKKDRQPAAGQDRREDHPWLQVSGEDDSLGEAVRYSLDEIRYA